ncbi:glutamine synthetase family protein [Brevibacillus daliensis]|uniref:glutamine synthetase family protein n=1 Tax=Brevibacillus daliensis TaxID=2892995 RepID=UPI001E55532B|nr:glutamine synthetase family protein [Brevibacillus daliensis]
MSVNEELIRQLQDSGVEFVRITYSDMHGYPRGKDIPLEYFKDVIEDGQAFCIANIVDGLASNPLHAPGLAPDRGYPDMRAIPDLTTIAPVPWEKNTVQCMVDLLDSSNGAPVSISPRQFLKRATELVKSSLHLTPVFAHELEFYLLQKTESGFARYSDHRSMQYTVGRRSDELGVMHHILQAGKTMGLGLTAANHEFSGGQFEVNMLHGEAVQSADRAFRFKNMVKEVSASHGLLATFMGKPFSDHAGSGFHLHVSLIDQENQNVFHDQSQTDGLSKLARHFMAGILHHGPALMAFIAPTINAYKRFVPESLVPLASNWGYDNRTTFIRIPGERGSGTRLELRAGDASANPYLISAVSLLAGYNGIVQEMELPSPISGDISLKAGHGADLPLTLEQSINTLLSDESLCELIGTPMINAYTAMKRVELERFRTYVTDWEMNEYVYHL